jgi:serine/threonine-protein kinase
MSKLAHPNCVSVVDFGVWDGAPYLVMEYVSGTTLRALIDNGALPPQRALALIRQIAAGLAHAHAQGVVHRDVKPANIMVTEEIGTGDHVRILDFGLARLRGAVGRDATQSNVVVGTPNYMAPEQTVGGGLIDARTDIYAAGVVLFEMITGERPFQADDTLALLGMHRAAPIPRLAERMPGVPLPRGLQDVVDTAMAKSPGERFQSAIELAEAIDAVSSARLGGEGGGDGGGDPVIRRTSEARKSAGLAPTVLDLSDAAELITPVPRRRSGGFFGSLLLLAILAGGVGAAVWWIKARGAQPAETAPGSAPGSATPATPATRDDKADPQPAAGSSGSAAASASPGGSAGSASTAGTAGSAGPAAAPGSGSAVGSGSAAEPVGGAVEAGSNAPEPAGSASPGAPAGGSAAAPDARAALDAGAVEPVPGPGSQAVEPPTEAAPGMGSGIGSDIEMDPTTAEDPAPASTKPTNDDDEEVNAPKTAEEVERHAPAAPVRATTLPGAVQLVQDGKRDLALASLRALWKKTPASAYIPFLLGNLYYDQRWWTVAMEHYAAAIKKNAQYKSNPTINRNVIRMLASNKTSRKAQGFLRFTVGRPALPYLRHAAQHDASSQVRRLAGWLTRAI